MILLNLQAIIDDLLESIDDLGDIVFLIDYDPLTIDTRITEPLSVSILGEPLVSDRVLRDISLFKQVAEASYELLNKVNPVMAVNILLHEVDDLIRESNVVVPYKRLAAFHSINDALNKVLVYEEILCVLRKLSKPFIFLFILPR